MRSSPLTVALAAACCAAICGCGWVPRSQWAAADAQNRSLGEQTRAQLAEIENLKNHQRKIEDKLTDAEGELALLDEQYGIDRQKLANLRDERERLRNSFGGLGAEGNTPHGLRGHLARLARKHKHLRFDPQTGISKLDTDVLFDSGEDVLKPGAEKLLRDFASFMNGQDAKQFKVMIVGHTDNQRIAGRETRHRFPSNWHLSAARALAVSDALRNAGLAGDRLGTAGFGQHQPIASNDSPASRRENRRVEIFVMASDVPVVGMTETLTNLY